MTSYWKLNDKNWVLERKKQWDNLHETIRYYYSGCFSRDELKDLEAYFLKGKIKTLGNTPNIGLIRQLIWHPSDDETVWLDITRQHNEHYKGCYDYRFLINNGKPFLHAPYKENIGISLFVGREAKLYHFFFRHPTVLGEYVYHRYESGDMTAAHKKLYHEANQMISYFERKYPKDGVYLYQGFPRQALAYLSEYFTSEMYQKFINPVSGNWSYWEEVFTTNAKVYADRHIYPIEQREIIEEWVEQIEKSAPEWQQAWFKIKQLAQDTYETGINQLCALEQDVAADEVEITVGGEALLSDEVAWTKELMQLKERLEQLGYPIQTDYPKLSGILNDYFGDTSVLFGLFTNDIYTDEDLEDPFEAFVYPLQRLCELSDVHQISYQRKGDYLYLRADGKQVGKIHLDDPLDEGAGKDGMGNYFREVVRLAHEWFPGQIYCYGEDEFVLYILPEPVVKLLAESGFASKLDYFGEWS